MEQKLKSGTPRERVLTALSHRQPARVPFAWNFGPTPEMTGVLTTYAQLQNFNWSIFAESVDDIRQILPRYIGPSQTSNLDIWGILRKSQSYGSGVYAEIANYPLAGVRDLEWITQYDWPNPDAYDYEHFREEVLASDPEEMKARKLAISVCGNPFEIYCWMTGLEEAMINTVLYPEVIHTAMGCITNYFSRKMRNALDKVGDLVDILYFADDLGGQQNLLMSLATYRHVIKPYHQHLFSLAHEFAPQAYIMFHSDGAVFNILPDLIDAGINILEAVQTDAAGMHPARLKSKFGDSLSFHGGISVQQLLPYADPETITRECENLIRIFGKTGGYIAAPSHAIQVGTPPENVIAMLRAVLGSEAFENSVSTSQMR